MTTPSLQQKLDRIHEKLNRQIPAEAQALMNANTQNLIDSNQASKARQQGDQIPFFALANQDGQQVSISDLFNPGPLVISFFRGFW